MSQHSWELADRSPAVAGMFYPAEPGRIDKTLDQWSRAADVSRERWRAALVPHAGWVYSGRLAADVLRRIEMPRTIIVLCPKHHPGGAECAIAPWQRWLFPGGVMEANERMGQQLADQVPAFMLDDTPHRPEHAIEVQLPLLARWAPQSRLVAITIGRLDLAQCDSIATHLGTVLRDQLDDVLLLVSSDMNHFANDSENRRLDEMALQTLDRLEPDQLYKTCHQHRISMCGMLPTVIVLKTLQHLGALQHAERVGYTTSAEASGDTQRVVGYAGMLFR